MPVPVNRYPDDPTPICSPSNWDSKAQLKRPADCQDAHALQQPSLWGDVRDPLFIPPPWICYHGGSATWPHVCIPTKAA